MKRPLAVIGFSYFTMLAFLIFVPQTALPYLFISLAALLLVSLIIKETRENKVFPLALLTCTAAVAVYYVNLNVNINPVQKLNETGSTISGTICEIPYKKNNKYNYVIKVKDVGQKEVRPFKLKLSSPEAIEGDAGDDFTGNVHFYIPQSSPNFDSQTYYRSKNIYIHAFLYNYEKNTAQKPKTIPFSYHILELRQEILSTTKRIFPVRTASVINGILLGEKHEFPSDIKNNFDMIGAYHLLTISGIHISMLSCFCLWLFKKLKLGIRCSAVLAALVIFAFMTLTCFTPSVMKAEIMSIIYLIGLAVFRKSDSLNSLGIAILSICIFNPNSALDIGLWMSFFSTLGIITVYRPIKNFICGKLNTQLRSNKIVRYIISGISVSLSIWAFTLPLVAWFFKKTTLISPLSNLTLIPVVTTVFASAFITDFIAILSAPALLVRPFAVICGTLTDFIIYMAKLLAKIPFAMISLDYSVAGLWAAFTVLLVAASICTKNFKRSSTLAALLSFNLALAAAFSYQISVAGTTTASVIDCSDGIGLVLSKDGRRAAVLCLNQKSNTTSIEYFLSSSYIKNMDYLGLPVLDSTHKSTVQNIIKTYCPQTSVFSGKNSADSKYDSTRTHAVYFADHIESSFWDDTEISTFESGEHTYMRVKTANTRFLILANGGNADDIPESWLNCDFLIANGLPSNYQKIMSRHTILSENRIDSEINAKKLISAGKNVYSVALQGRLYIRIKPNGNYEIRRSR